MNRILAVDDNRDGLYMLQTLLQGCGYDVTTAENGIEALQNAREMPPDLLITDILMPKMDGFSLCSKWMASDTLKNIPLLFYTATYVHEEDRSLAMSMGATTFLIKPMDPADLIKVIKEVFGEIEKGMTPAATEQGNAKAGHQEKYNEALFRKLEDKLQQLAETNQALQSEIEERKQVQKKLQASLREKETLLREIHHRVKNNLQVVSSLLRLQAGTVKSEQVRNLFANSRNQIKAMALVHEKMYLYEDLCHIDFADYIRTLRPRFYTLFNWIPSKLSST